MAVQWCCLSRVQVIYATHPRHSGVFKTDTKAYNLLIKIIHTQNPINLHCQLKQELKQFNSDALTDIDYETSGILMKNYCALFVVLPFLTITPQVSAHVGALDLTVDVGSVKQKGNRFSESDNSMGLSLGYELNSHWSLNLSYTDFGEIFTGRGGLIFEEDYFETQHFIATKGVGLSAQYLTEPLIAGWAFGARVGLMHVDSKMRTVAPDFMNGFSYLNKDSGTFLTLGVLSTYSLTEQMNLITSIDYMAPEVRTSGIGDEDIKTTRIAVGLNYHF